MTATDLLPTELDGPRSAVAPEEPRPDPARLSGTMSSTGEHHQSGVELGEPPAAAASATLPRSTTPTSDPDPDPPSQDPALTIELLEEAIPEAPSAPSFPLRKLDRIAYTMSISTGALGQVLFLGLAFGGAWWAYAAAAGLAAFAEVVMAASGDSAMEHRRAGRKGWQLLLALGLSTSIYAGLINVSHFWHQNRSMAFMFGGASVLGFLLHLANGYIEVSAYLKAQKERLELLRQHQLRAEQLRRDELARRQELEARVAVAEAEARGRHAAELEAAERRQKAEQARIEREFKLTEPIVRQYVVDNDYPNAAAVWAYYVDKYGEHRLPNQRSVQRWVQQVHQAKQMASA